MKNGDNDSIVEKIVAYFWIVIFITIVIYFIVGLFPRSNYIKIKYREDEVNISASNFEPLKKSDSTVKGAWYDSDNKYMVIKLGEIYYHYCGVPSSIWGNFKTASSTYGYYQDGIKGNFDCRENPVPRYE